MNTDYVNNIDKLKSANDNVIYSCNSIYDNQKTIKSTNRSAIVHTTTKN